MAGVNSFEVNKEERPPGNVDIELDIKRCMEKDVNEVTKVARLTKSKLHQLNKEDILDNLEFAKGRAESTWGSVRAAMGILNHSQSNMLQLEMKIVGKKITMIAMIAFLRSQGNCLKFYNAIKEAYLDILMISNYDGSSTPLDHPANLYDFHVCYLLPDLFAFLVV
ncbi:arabinoxylan arabinofuranohydrolase [Hordeum vulgare]|nr:arabinoxylan arabinofuranohydrolase [Hordeum vulgare]